MLFALALTLARLTIIVRPTVLVTAQSVTVICRVIKHETNRGLELGIENIGASYAQLDGEAASVQHTATFKQVTCEAGRPYCLLEDNAGRRWIVYAPFEAGPCS